MGEHQFREDGSHYNGGAEFFGYGYAAQGEPRLKMIRRWYRRGAMRGKTEDRFFVDGAHVETYAAAIEALKVPPTLSDEECARLLVLSALPEKFDLRRGSDDEFRLDYSLRAKGFISALRGTGCLTDAGRAALSTSNNGAGG